MDGGKLRRLRNLIRYPLPIVFANVVQSSLPPCGGAIHLLKRSKSENTGSCFASASAFFCFRPPPKGEHLLLFFAFAFPFALGSSSPPAASSVEAAKPGTQAPQG